MRAGPDPKIAAGNVVAQDPPAGTTSRRAAERAGLAQRRVRAAKVPALTGETERTAQLRLDAGRPRRWRRLGNPIDGFPADIVIAQEPPAKSAGVARGAAGEPSRAGGATT